jgi:hypothetical protein
MPVCNDCKAHFLKYPLEIAGWYPHMHEELPSLYHNTPTCPYCGLIGDMKNSKLKDGLSIVKAERDDPEVILNFMAFYRKRQKDFRDGYSIAKAFLEGI